MPYRIHTVRTRDEYRGALGAIGHYFGWEPTDEDAERFEALLPLGRMHVARDGERVVGGAGAFPLELTLPAGPVRCAGVSVVGVLPSDRRRGVLRRMMEAQLREARALGEPLAALWASEETIYGRYGYGHAGHSLWLDAERTKVRIAPDVATDGKVRLVDHDEAFRVFPRLYERVRRSRVGHLSRSRDWWETRRLGDRPEQRRGSGPLVRALLERDGRPLGYALYRIAQDGSTPADWRKTVRVGEVVALDDAATRDLWRFLFEIDWTDRVQAYCLPLDHPLLLLADRPNHLEAKLLDGLWVRLVDVEAALAARGFRAGRAVIEVTHDPVFAGNVATFAIADGRVRRVRQRADVRVDVQTLGAAFLGGFSFAELAAAGHVDEARRGGIARADAVFRVDAQPWCPEVF
ncbi:MAG: GNAT family N-acetyltransferase [Gaiella sp.]